MRTLDEVERAHNFLHAIIEFNGKQKEPIDELLSGPLHVSHDVLSWVLDDSCGHAFADNLAMLQAKMNDAGYHVVKRK